MIPGRVGTPREGVVSSRREFVHFLAGGAAAVAGCGIITGGDHSAGSARLSARPGTPTSTVTPGTHPLGLGSSRDGFLLVPASYDPAHATPLMVAHHGAGIGASGPIDLLGPYAESHGFLLLACDSREATWDAITGQFGPDLSFLDRALRQTFGRCNVDPTRVVVEGFSDGASYCLALGLANGDLFSRVVAFSPGFIPPSNSQLVGRPEFFVSHGQQDPILPIDTTSRRIVPALQGLGYSVTFVEFDGGHSVPSDIAEQAVTWMLG